jgi:hypothetical protein
MLISSSVVNLSLNVCRGIVLGLPPFSAKQVTEKEQSSKKKGANLTILLPGN